MARSHRITVPGIYQIRNMVDDRVYVGSSWNIPDRWKAHRLLLTRGNHHSRRLQKAWDKHGADVFVFEILEFCYKRHKLVKIEQDWLDRLRSYEHGHGYNIMSKANQKTIIKAQNKYLCLSNVMRLNKRQAVPLPDAEREAIWKAYSREEDEKEHYDAIDIIEAARIRLVEQDLKKKIARAKKSYQKHIDNKRRIALTSCYARGRLYTDKRFEPERKQ